MQRHYTSHVILKQPGYWRLELRTIAQPPLPKEKHTMPSYVLYVDNARIGTFRGPAGSTRNVSAFLKKKYPNLDIAKVKIAKRWFICGRWTDGEQIQAEL